MTRLLFIAKKRKNGGGYSTSSIGLLNSIWFVKQELEAYFSDYVKVDVVVVNDNNDIDREVTKHRPDVVIIDALWVVPEKFIILKKLHPKVEWVVRIHSEAGFLATEGIAFEWLPKYLKNGVKVAVNCKEAQAELQAVFNTHIMLLPNLYPLHKVEFKRWNHKSIIKVGCFGAIRPLKNQLIQAMAAINFANENNIVLEFHINADRVERGGDQVLKNLRALFSSTKHKLVEHPWYDHASFLKIIQQMDVCMSVSFTETFCIVAADTVKVGVPLVGSDAIPWLGCLSTAHPTDINDITNTLCRVLGYAGKMSYVQNRKNLHRYNKEGLRNWYNELLL